MILQNDQCQNYQKDGENQMEIRKSDEYGIKLVGNIFTHSGNLFDDNQAKDEIHYRSKYKAGLTKHPNIFVDIGNH